MRHKLILQSLTMLQNNVELLNMGYFKRFKFSLSFTVSSCTTGIRTGKVLVWIFSLFAKLLIFKKFWHKPGYSWWF